MELLSEYDCSHHLPVASSPFDPTVKLSSTLGEPLLDATSYKRLIGKLNYLTHSRPDICFAKSKKQLSVSLSLAEAEYRSMRWVVGELTWLNRLLLDLGYPPELPIPVHSDSQSAIHIARNPIFHERTKHVELDCHFVRQQFPVGLISLSYVPASSQLADLFTKALIGPSHHTILPKLGLSALPSNLVGGGC
ncbi:hypothetical protein MTR67_045173 [Solanum verrucosum]|uniref:Retrovirus-related Pol polyprotein from transposon RE1 n=1 Tax=Solanum verrucosum TaxID=315347 RepID=A0AAF0URT3_SOLVR|nr:hypothetical protein MTR67_045173 [Solanum verrucosum]